MTESDSERKNPSPGEDVESAGLSAGLAAAFRRGPRAGESVLDALVREGAPRPATRLREGSVLGEVDAEGTRAHTHYTFSDEIGRGGVGVVIRGTDVDLGRDVALKILRDEYAEHPQALARFVEEAQVEGQLQHPGIIPVYELGMTQDGRPFFAMKLIEGKTLAEELTDRESPGAGRRRFLGIYEQICQAMAYAHTRGVVHRDLKPSNVMVGSFGEVQILDWGLAKVLGRDEEERPLSPEVRTVRTEGTSAETQLGSAMGTPNYMPPEQAKGQVKEIDERADVFALGGILLEILTGEPPYRHTSENTILQAVRAQLEDAEQRLDGCDADPELVNLCRRCLRPEREERPRDAREVAEGIGAYLAGVEERAQQAEIAAAQARVKAQEERKARRLTVALAGSVLLALILGGGGVLYVQGERRAKAQEAGQAATAALGEARERLGEARRADVGDLASWQAALDAARRAKEVAETGGAVEEVRESARALHAEIRDGHEDARLAADRQAQDDQVASRLEEIRLRRGRDFAFLEVDADYEAALRAYGLDVDTADVDATAAAIRTSSIADELCAALDDWAQHRIRYSKEEAEKAKQLLAIASAADTDGWRVNVRDTAAARDDAGLREVAGRADPGEQSSAGVMLFANALVDVENVEAGIDWLQKSRTYYPDDFWIHYQLGYWLLNQRKREPGAALGALRTALALNPQSVEVRIQIGQALRALGREDEAIAVWRHILDLQPRHHEANIQLCRSLRDRDPRELEALLPSYEKEAKAARDDPFLHWRRGTALRILGRATEAIEAYRRAIEIAPDYGRPWFGIGFIHAWEPYGVVDYEKAETYLEEAARRMPGRWLVWMKLAQVTSALEKHEEAARAYEQAARAAPEQARFHVNAVHCWVQAGDKQGALDAYDRLLERFPDDISLADLEFRIAHLFAQEYRRQVPRMLARRAIDRLEEGLRQGTVIPENTTATIGMLYCDVLDDFETAVGWFEKALAMKERHHVRMNLGLATQMLGHFDEAIAYHRGAIEGGLPSATAPAFLGFCLLATGDVEGAVDAFQAALEHPAWRPSVPWVRLHAGLLELDRGRTKEGLALLRQSREVDAWPEERQVSDDAWTAFSQEMQEAAELRPAVERGEAEPTSGREQAVLANFCNWVARYDLAVRFYEKAFEADPSLHWERTIDLEYAHHVDAAASAAGARVAGWGHGAPPPTPEERTRLHQQALAWMRAALEGWELAVPETLSPVLAAEVVTNWGRNGMLARLREERHLANLPPEEADACRAYWKDVAAFMERLEAMRE